MNNQEKYNEAFTSSLGIDGPRLAGLEYQSVDTWDSVGHIELVAALEEAFDIMLDTDDIIDLSSYEKGIEILKKYGVEL